MSNKFTILFAVILVCGLVSFISTNGTDRFFGKKTVENITYKMPSQWDGNISTKQFRLLEVTLKEKGDFSLVLFSNIQGSAQQNIDRWINQFQIDNYDDIIVDQDSLEDKTISTVKLYGTYEVPNMINRNAPKELKEDYGLLGGVVEFKNSIYFVKAVGNNQIIKNNIQPFNEFIYSISLK
tara:strand:+ start:286 stop:828 length:543 start_codon:yes stop_codon:yes gene_type:complete